MIRVRFPNGMSVVYELADNVEIRPGFYDLFRKSSDELSFGDLIAMVPDSVILEYGDFGVLECSAAPTGFLEYPEIKGLSE